MTLAKKEIKICMGSSCFSRGNRQSLQVIQGYLNDHQLENEVILKGNHCFGDCNEGPLVKIGSNIYKHVHSDGILEILEDELGALKDE